MESVLKIGAFQIYFDPKQLRLLDSSLMPYDNTKNPQPMLREYWVFKQSYDSKTYAGYDYTGFLSWKFGAKTGLTGEQFLQFIKSNPGYDVYLINPFPEEIIKFDNVWQHGEFHHPGILNLTESILKKAGIDISLRDTFTNPSRGGFCNFWVGSPMFWETYVPFLNKIVDVIENKLSHEEQLLMKSRACKVIDADYFSFIVERLFVLFLELNPQIKVKNYVYSKNVLCAKLGDIAGERVFYDELLRTEYFNPQSRLFGIDALGYYKRGRSLKSFIVENETIRLIYSRILRVPVLGSTLQNALWYYRKKRLSRLIDSQ